MSDDARTLLPGQRLRARGARENPAGRFEPERREAVADGWDLPEDDRLVCTEVRIERPRSGISYNRSPDLPFDRSVNPYRGCEHGCAYCYARPSHAFLNLSPGVDFETRLIARPGIDAVLAQELRAKSYSPAPIALGTNTDPYQPCEAEHRVTRGVLEVLRDFHHPVAIVTKGTLIERDIDILGPMGQAGLARVGVSVTTLDAPLARQMEPRCPPPARRLETIRRLAEAGVPVRVMVSPVVPGLTDTELEAILKAARDAGATSASWIMLRLPLEVAALFRDWLAEHRPGEAAKIMARVRELHGGRDYDPEFGRRMRGRGVWSDLMDQRFRKALTRLGLTERQPPMDTGRFCPPPRPGDQLTLL
ncbi:PA0069 family radical SAM protein [Aliigemmobacter aestuarii]|uniref:PA0069 family radical SAM protein n=1 Tax=Aliigemmobacter aestuarii TaxID=1445661 RepID=A0A4S3MIT8_9RHOB|nr:PA0069 family radical SAM protein [Gemmobacter aestuarii]THD81208.1 PA0069 family radical SAM protein [Gemmobacter aestuarii]